MCLAGHLLGELVVDEEHRYALDYVSPRPADAEVDGGFAGNQRAFDLEMSVHKAYRGVAVPLLEVAVAHAHVHHGRQPAAEAGGEAAFVEVRVADNVRVKGREHADKVADLVHRHLIQEEKIVRAVASAYIETGRELRAVRDAGQHLKSLDKVRGAEDGEVAAYLRAVDFLDAGLGGDLADSLFVADDCRVQSVHRGHRKAILP